MADETTRPREAKRLARQRRRKKAQALGQAPMDPKRQAARKRRALRRKRDGEAAPGGGEADEAQPAASDPPRAAASAAAAADADPRVLELAKRLEKWQPPLHADGFPLIVLWTPKAGCTTMVKWFLFQAGLLDQALAYDPWPHNYRKYVLQAQPDFNLRTAELLLSGQRPIVKLVRDPWQRAVSSYLQLCFSLRPGRESWADRTIRRMHKTLGTKPQRATISFREYAKALALGRSVREGMNSHVTEQYSLGEDDLPIRLIRLENFTAEIRALEAELGLPPAPLDQISTSGHHRGGKSRVIPGAADLQATARTFSKTNAPSYESFYDAETASDIATAFKRDFERYGYAPDRLPRFAA